MNSSTVLCSIKHWCFQAMVVAVLVLLSRSEWVLGGLYTGEQSLGGICLAVIVLFFAVTFGLVLLAIALPPRLTKAMLRVLTISVAIYIFEPAIRALFFVPAKLETFQKIILIACTLMLAWMGSTLLSSSQWKRMQAALLFGGFVFVSFPILAVRATDSIQVRMPAGAQAQGATVVLLLDELNANASEQIAADIKQAGGVPRVHRIKTVGTATISVIPEMFGGPHMPRARVCAPTAVCDLSAIFDFSRLRFAPLDRVHIIGFHHPYCAAQGLASCAMFAPPNPPPITSLLCSFDRLRVGRRGSQCDWLPPEGWDVFRWRMRDATLQSPFWKSGGTLYAHLPFPHPPGNLPRADLTADYADNLRLASEIVAQVWRQGNERFGASFRLIVTSDHPLRPELWCRHGKYLETGCGVKPTGSEGLVPYILVGGNEAADSVPTDNGKIFTGKL